jgi:CRP/FNR family transcriptional activator FtrB
MSLRATPENRALAALPWFTAFAPAQLSALDEIADLVLVGPNELVTRAGAPVDDLIILLSGFVIETHPHHGVDTLTEVIAPPAALGLAPALLGGVALATARTITPARLVLIPARSLRDMINADPALCRPFLDHALTAMQALSREVWSLKLHSAAQRLADYLLDLVPDPNINPARFVLPYEKRFLAARIGCSQENLSRAFAALRRFGVITRRGIVVLGDVPGLRDFARREPGPEPC